jgi:hypothetical protein
MAMSDTIEMQTEMRPHVEEFRRLATSGKFDEFTTKLLHQLADGIEKRAREFDGGGERREGPRRH